MAETTGMTPYSTVRPFLGTLPSWVPPLDQERIASYQKYEEMYWDVPETYKIVQRGSDSLPIYVPNGRIIVNTTNRFLARGETWLVDPAFGTPEEQKVASGLFTRLFRRERWRSKSNMNKRYGLIRGDAFYHVVADPKKAPGRRISIYTLDPASVFWIHDPDDADKIIGVHIVDQVVFDNKTLLLRQTYRKTENGRITTELAIFKPDKWADPALTDGKTNPQPEKVLVPLQELPEDITAIPVYHVRNFEEPGNPYGSSELRGLEVLSAAVNQTVSDENLILALEGLGMYATNADPPTDDDGNETTWKLGPGRVVEVAADREFKRISGVGSVEPTQSHVMMLVNFMREAAGTPDVAIGSVDVSIAESGIALQLRMGPMLAKNEEKEDIILDVKAQMYYDIQTMWFPAFEAVDLSTVSVVPHVGSPLPVDRAGSVQEIIALYEAKLISAEYARQKLSELGGYDIPADMGQAILTETAELAKAGDPFAGRVETELLDEDADAEGGGAAG